MMWSGGKDSFLSMCKAIDAGYTISYLISIIKKEDNRSTYHLLSEELIKLQAECLDIPYVKLEVSGFLLTHWQHTISTIFCKKSRLGQSILRYMQGIKKKIGRINKMPYAVFISNLYGGYNKQLKKKLYDIITDNIQYVIGGDVYLWKWGQKQFFDRLCKELGVTYITPICNLPEKQIIFDVLNLGIESIIISVNTSLIDKEWLGRKCNSEFFRLLEEKNICLSGERGEYHTFVVDGPFFKKRINIDNTKVITKGEYKFLDILSYSLGESCYRKA